MGHGLGKLILCRYVRCSNREAEDEEEDPEAEVDNVGEDDDADDDGKDGDATEVASGRKRAPSTGSASAGSVATPPRPKKQCQEAPNLDGNVRLGANRFHAFLG